eukprot:CAMPEP_0118633770 /NCGR_PEP_ID=MMETSP0785-20121206/1178_1 /TAXON_ID=91992 /ORGANISM="Bolidomonas pacifica, Strain CCMP 1866" /LENGTH=193 /DNA_ID=CAMNT_0006524675 /DNA_START=459 /DNA_END=1036 /DNA_ORIENTATION=+
MEALQTGILVPTDATKVSVGSKVYYSLHSVSLNPPYTSRPSTSTLSYLASFIFAPPKISCKIKVVDYDYDEMSIHTLMNAVAQASMMEKYKTVKKKFTSLTIHNQSRYVPPFVTAFGNNCDQFDGRLDVVFIMPCNGVALLKRARKAIHRMGNRWYSNSRSVLYLHAKEIKISALDVKGGKIEIDGVPYGIEG